MNGILLLVGLFFSAVSVFFLFMILFHVFLYTTDKWLKRWKVNHKLNFHGSSITPYYQDNKTNRSRYAANYSQIIEDFIDDFLRSYCPMFRIKSTLHPPQLIVHSKNQCDARNDQGAQDDTLDMVNCHSNYQAINKPECATNRVKQFSHGRLLMGLYTLVRTLSTKRKRYR